MIDVLDLPHADARALLATGVPVYLPINPVEYHGPHLSLHNDTLVSRGLARAMHAALGRPDWPLLVCADLEVGVEPVPGKGTRPVPYPTARALVVGACRALAELGAQRVVLMSFHGSPLHNVALDAGVDELLAHGVRALAPLCSLLDALIEISPELRARVAPAMAALPDAALRQLLLDELPLDFHAGFFETSMALALAPHSVSAVHRDLPPCPKPEPNAQVAAMARAMRAAGRARLARELEFIAEGLGWYAVKPFPGYTGRPQYASVEAGRVFVDVVTEEYARHGRAVLLEGAPPPRPPLSWIRWVTAGGRLTGGLSVDDGAAG